MATFTELIGLQSGVQAVANTGYTINFSGITLSNFSTDSISDGTGTVDFGAAGALQTSGIAAKTPRPARSALRRGSGLYARLSGPRAQRKVAKTQRTQGATR